MNENENKDAFEKGAYHECGHIVFAYFTEYVCDKVELLFNNPGEGFSKIDYGEDLMLVNGIINCMEHPEFFNSLDANTKQQSPAVAHRIATILVAGSASDSYYKKIHQKGQLEVEISGPDLQRLDNIDHFLSKIKKEKHPSNYIQDTLRKIMPLVELNEFWTAIDALAKQLLQTKDYKLGRKAIEEILTSCGYLDYLKSIRK